MLCCTLSRGFLLKWRCQGRTWGPRVECPYQINIGNRTLLKISAVGYGKDVLFSGAALGNGSRFEPDPGAENGVDMDFGDVYAAAVRPL